MRVGILDSGLIGGKLGMILAHAGHEVVFSYARNNEKLKRLARETKGNARAGTPGEAAKEADALLLAVHWSRTDDVLKQTGDLSGKVIVTCSLPMDAGNTKLIIGTTTSGAEELAKKVPHAHIVCAFNTVPSEVLFGVFETRTKAVRPWKGYETVMTYGWLRRSDEPLQLVPLTVETRAELNKKVYWCRSQFTNYRVFSSRVTIVPNPAVLNTSSREPSEQPFQSKP